MPGDRVEALYLQLLSPKIMIMMTQWELVNTKLKLTRSSHKSELIQEKIHKLEASGSCFKR